MPLRRLAQRPKSVLRRFLQLEASGGIVLITAALLALGVANSALAPSYLALLATPLGPLDLKHWINDGAMAVFFFVVGLEIKREWYDGHLSTWSDRRLPMIAAAAGMAVPAFVYLTVTGGSAELARGWAIPAATDIAFAIGVLALVGRRAPASLKLFLTTVAIVDDMGAVAIIAIAYTEAIHGGALLGSLAVVGVLFALNRFDIVSPWVYVTGFALLWLAVFASGVHATIAGVLAAMMVPLKNTPGRPDDLDSTLHRMERALHPWVAFAIVPLFGFANAGVALGGVGLSELLQPLPLGIALGLVLGKQVGVFGAAWLTVRSGLAPRPAGASWLQVYGVALLCGVGFTMSLFIGELAFDDPATGEAVKIGVLLGSLVSAIAGFLVLRFAASRRITLPRATARTP